MTIARRITSKSHPLWVAYIIHRLSGLGLVLFLPIHFWVLALAMTNPERLDGFLRLTETGAVKAVEVGLVFLLAMHMFGGLRLLALEMLSWRPSQKTLAASAVAGAFFVAALFLMKVI